MIVTKRRETIPINDPEVFPAVRDLYYRDRSVLEVDPLQLSGILKVRSYLDYYPSLSAVGAAQDLLEEKERAWGVA